MIITIRFFFLRLFVVKHRLLVRNYFSYRIVIVIAETVFDFFPFRTPAPDFLTRPAVFHRETDTSVYTSRTTVRARRVFLTLRRRAIGRDGV